ncbi:MAG: hypothetical protein ACOC4J_04470 [Bacteroidota bacterium]
MKFISFLVPDGNIRIIPGTLLINTMKMKRPIILLAFLSGIFCLAGDLSAQAPMGKPSKMKLNYRGYVMQTHRWEGGFSVGVANSMTDVASSQAGVQASMTDVYSRGLSPALAIYSRYRFGDLFAVRGNASALMLRGNDRWSTDLDVVNRGRSFTNTLFEAAAVGEIYMPKKRKNLKSEFSLNRFDLYLFGGVSAFYHSPDVKGAIIDEYDRSILEAENIYSKLQVGLPLGAGMQWLISNRWVLGMDFNFRYTFFDFLDGFKRPYSTRNDFFFTSNVSLGYVISSQSYQTGNSAARHVFIK